MTRPYGEFFRVPTCVSRSGRWRFKRLTNRRLRRCVHGSPRWVYLWNDMTARWDAWQGVSKREAK